MQAPMARLSNATNQDRDNPVVCALTAASKSVVHAHQLAAARRSGAGDQGSGEGGVPTPPELHRLLRAVQAGRDALSGGRAARDVAKCLVRYLHEPSPEYTALTC